jgi:hypothetical protein
MITKRIVFTLLVIASLLGARAGSLHAQSIGANNCSGISLGWGSYLNCSMDASQICYEGNCIPWIAGCSEHHTSDCSTAGRTDVCDGNLYKSQAFLVAFPDYTTIQTTPALLQGYGQTTTSWKCSTIGNYPVFPRLECWPIFYKPVLTDGGFVAREKDNLVVALPSNCAMGQKYHEYGCSNELSTTMYPTEADAYHRCCPTKCNGGGGGDECPPTCTDLPYDPMSPIVVDVNGEGYELTDLLHGVIFNLTGQGAQRISWTDPKRGNAWLALDRNGNGAIDDGSELFGNNTPQPKVPGVSPNGFLATLVQISVLR